MPGQCGLSLSEFGESQCHTCLRIQPQLTWSKAETENTECNRTVMYSENSSRITTLDSLTLRAGANESGSSITPRQSKHSVTEREHD